MLRHDVRTQERLETAACNDIERPPVKKPGTYLGRNILSFIFKPYLFAQKLTMKQYHKPQNEDCLLRP